MLRVNLGTALARLSLTVSGREQNLNRLATMRQINQAKDDPAGLIALEALQSELTQLDALSRQLSQAESRFNSYDSDLANASEILQRLRGNAVAAVGASAEEQAALQVEADFGLDALRLLAARSDSAPRQISFEAIGQTYEFASINPAELGVADLATGQAAAFTEDPALAVSRIDDALEAITQERVRAGSYVKNTIGSLARVVEGQSIQIAQAASQIGDADVAEQTALLARNQILERAQILAFKQAQDSQGLILELLA